MVAPVLLTQIAVGEIILNGAPVIGVPKVKQLISLLGMSFLLKLLYFNEADGRLTLRR